MENYSFNFCVFLSVILYVRLKPTREIQNGPKDLFVEIFDNFTFTITTSLVLCNKLCIYYILNPHSFLITKMDLSIFQTGQV